MQPQMQTTKQSAPTAQPQRDMSKTYYFGPSDENEEKIALAWLMKSYPEANTPGHVRYVTSLLLDRLTEEHTVIVLARTKKRTDALKTERDPSGIARVIRSTPEELSAEIIEGTPVHCRDHWYGQEGGQEGELIVHTFLQALGKTSIPWVVKPAPADSRTTPRIYRLGWA